MLSDGFDVLDWGLCWSNWSH